MVQHEHMLHRIYCHFEQWHIYWGVGCAHPPGTEQHPMRVVAPPEILRTPLENEETTNIFTINNINLDTYLYNIQIQYIEPFFLDFGLKIFLGA